MTPSSRRGRFLISTHFLDGRHPAIERIMDMCAIVSADVLVREDCVQYTAECYLFRQLAPGDCVPEYAWIIVDAGNGEFTVRVEEMRGDGEGESNAR